MTTPPQWLVRLPSGERFGPAPMDAVERWAAEGRVPPDATLVAADGSQELPVARHERLRPIVLAPPTRAGPLPSHPPDDGAISTIIPFRNGPALAAYYTAVLSLIPGVGLLAGPAALALGIAGLRLRTREPHRKGAVHAWIGIIVGVLVTVVHAAVILLIVLSV
ncbi:MAG: hypothetical protein KIS87_14600 [Phycisphaeraceae bacterium]|nr:hypothetical protein [Phycisphaeraceae bacterium]